LCGSAAVAALGIATFELVQGMRGQYFFPAVLEAELAERLDAVTQFGR
jgi:hypothetical protein